MPTLITKIVFDVSPNLSCVTLSIPDGSLCFDALS